MASVVSGVLRGAVRATVAGRYRMSWVFTGVMKRARNFEREQARRFNEGYARWHKKHRELPRGREPEQERRLLGTRDRERNHRREG
jgi:hypothetical protein